MTVSSGPGWSRRLARTVSCSTPRDTPEYASITLRLVYLPRPKPSWSDPSRAAAIAHTFSVHDGSVVPTVAKVSTTWWVNCSSAGSRGPTGLATMHVLREVVSGQVGDT